MIAKYVEQLLERGHDLQMSRHAVQRAHRRRHESRLDADRGRRRAIRARRPVVVVDDEDRENEGDLIFAAEQATPELVAS